MINAVRPALLAAGILALATGSALAQAASTWPESARDRGVGRPSWVLVIPARRRPDGGLAIWDRDPWGKAWRVPRAVRGLRFVTLMGDSEDRRAVTPEAIDDLLIDDLSAVMRKYGAPALALAVSDGSSVAVAGWAPGQPAGWRDVAAGGTDEAARGAALAALDQVFSGRSGQGPDAPAPPQAAGEVEIVAFRERGDGGRDYKVLAGAGAAEALARMPGTTVVSEEPRGTRTEMTLSRSRGAGSLEDDMRRAGVSARIPAPAVED